MISSLGLRSEMDFASRLAICTCSGRWMRSRGSKAERRSSWDADYLVFHGYDAHDKGRSKLRIEKLVWPGGWPAVLR
ncbi:MAG TPA: hypothetical protein VF939_01725 [Puia sp.]